MNHRDAYRHRLEQVATTDKLVKLALRELRRAIPVEQVAVADHDGARDQWEPEPGNHLDDEEVRAALRREKVPGRSHVLALQLEVDPRHRKILVLRREAAARFSWKEVEEAREVLDLAAAQLRRRAEERRRTLVERTYAQLLGRLRGNDLHYQILHATRSLVDYDHSGAVFVYEPEVRRFRLQAEQIAWTKGRSRLIGTRLDLTASEDAILAANNRMLLYRRTAGAGWQAEGPASPAVPRAALEFHREDPERPEPASAMLAPLVYEGRCIGLLAAYGLHPLSLSPTSCDDLLPLVPLAAIAIHNQMQDEGLEQAFLEEQKKNAVAEIARGVAHDINNALTVLLLRTRLLREELEGEEGTDSRKVEDLRQVEQYAGNCKRIFQGMLQYSRRGTAPYAAVDLKDCVRHVLELQGRQLESAGLRTVLRIDAGVPPVRGNAQQLERVLHNLVQNAQQSTPAGCTVTVALRRRGGHARLLVLNSGVVVPKRVLQRVMEPFFTTRREGHGLGLALARSIVAEHRGTIRMRSRRGTGTLVSVRLPLARSRADSDAAARAPA